MSGQDILLLKGREIERLLAGRERDVVEVVRAGYEIHGRGESSLPHSVFLRFPDDERNRIIALPAYLGGDFRVAGMKWVSSFPGNLERGLNRASAIVVLNSAETGRPETILEGSLISARRTAASAALAAERLVREETPAPVGLVGCGLINFEVVRFLRALKLIRANVFVYDTDAQRAEAFRKKCAAEFPELALEVVPETEVVLARAGVVSFATTAARPHVFDVSMCQKGTVILHVSLRDLSPEVILGCENVVDDVDHVCRAQTSLHLAEQLSGHRDFINCTLAEILSGRSERSDEASGVTVFSPFGLGVLDLALSALVRDLAVDHKCGQWIEDFLP
ncbi:MAG TPA: 2,3-diaminopropionate biosynthesis protein SbnB [Pyrinomonadaceae bacterium]|nr:2,3-diaminopropionate biosynthesis protein SbnB [Pyrinomonadaceae bacterium]